MWYEMMNITARAAYAAIAINHVGAFWTFNLKFNRTAMTTTARLDRGIRHGLINLKCVDFNMIFERSVNRTTISNPNKGRTLVIG